MNRTEWATIAGAVNTLWPNARWGAETVRAAEPLILDLDARATMAAVHDLAAEGRDFPPPPGLLRKRSVELSHERIPDADEAWRQVGEQIGRCGATTFYNTREPEFTHPAIEAAVAAMGWNNLCMSTNQMADRAHFMQIYGSVVARAQRDRVMPETVRMVLEEVAERLALPPGKDLEPAE